MLTTTMQIVSLVEIYCIIVKLFKIMPYLLKILHYKYSPKLFKSIFFQTPCCSMTHRRLLMCVVSLVVISCIIVNIIVFSFFGVALCRRSLQHSFLLRLRIETNNVSSSEDGAYWLFLIKM